MVGVTIAFLLIGLFLGCRITIKQEVKKGSGEYLVLSEGQVAAQRLLGNDYCIEEAVFYVSEIEGSEDAQLEIYLTKGGYDLKQAEIEAVESIPLKDIKEKNQITVSFGNKKLIYQRDYYLVFAYMDSDPYGRISLEKADSGYGLFGREAQADESLAYYIKYQSRGGVPFFIWKVIFLYGFCSLGICLWFHLNYYEAMAVSCLGSSIWMYAFALLGIMKWGVYLLWIFAVVGVGLWIYELKKKTYGQIIEFLREYLISGIICWGIILFLYLIVDSSRSIYGGDDFIQWAHAPKLMYLFDKIPVHEKSTLALFRYPPLFSLFQYLFLEIQGRFSVEALYFSKHFFETGLLLGCMAKSKRNLALAVPMSVFLIIGLQSVFFDGYQVHNLYVDITLAIIWGYVLVQIFELLHRKSLKNMIFLIMGVLVLTLTKEVGVVLALITIAGMICIWLYRRKEIVTTLWLKCIGIITGTFAIAGMSWQIWLKSAVKTTANSNVVRSSTASNTVAASGYGLEKIVNYLTGKGEAYQYEIIPRHFHKLFFEREFINPIFSLPYFGWIMVLCCIVLLITWQNTNWKKTGKSIAIFTLVTGILEAVFMHLSYTFTFGESVAVIFESERRYLGTVIMGLAVFIIVAMEKSVNNNLKAEVALISVFCILVYVLSNGLLNYRLKITDPSIVDYGSDIAQDLEQAEALKSSNIIGESQKTCYISMDGTGNEWIYYQYYLSPGKLTNITSFFRNSDLKEEEAKEYLSEFDYLFIRDGNEQFVAQYGTLLENIEEINDMQLYQIRKQEEQLLEGVSY